MRKDILYYYFQGLGAYKEKDYPAFLSNFEVAVKLSPGHPEMMYHLARAHALLGNKEEAIVWLNRCIDMGFYFDVYESKDFDSIRDSGEFKAILKKIEGMKTPVNNSEIAFVISEKDLMPEGITYDPAEEKFYIGSLHKRKVTSIDRNGKIEDFIREKQDGLWGVAGIKVDAKRRILWVNSVALPNMRRSKKEKLGLSGVFKYDLNNGKLIKKYLDNKPNIHLFNDLVINSEGDVFITNSLFGAIYVIPHERDELELFVKPDRFTYPNGIALSGDERYLYVIHAEGASIIDIGTRSCFALTHSEDIALTGIEGLYFYRNSLVAIQNGYKPERVIRFFLNEGLNRVEGAEIIEVHNPLFMFSTTGVIVDDMFYYIANSQLNCYNDDHTTFPMDKLHDIVILKAKL